MKKIVIVLTALMTTITGICFGENWPQWRGPALNGVSVDKNLPTHWSNEENILWKLALPERSGATPIIWGETIFLNIAEGDVLSLWAVNRKDGSVLWKRPLGSGNIRLNKQNMSSPSPVTDGGNVYVMTGTGILKGFDFAGKELWTRDIQEDYGKFGLNWGYASSPLLYDDSLFIQVLHGMKTQDPSYLLRINKRTGKTVWRVERPTPAIKESPDSYTTPTLVRHLTEVEIVVTGGDCMTGHDPATGKELWRANGFNPDNDPFHRIIASPVVADEIIYAPTKVRPLMAFRSGGRGDISQSHLLWSFQNGPDVPSPVSDGKYFFSINDKGIAWCLDAKTGKEIWGPQRLKPAIYSASPVLADGKIYLINEEGLTTVLRAGSTFEILAENPLNDYTLSSPAISNGHIFIRTAKYLYCIGKPGNR
jgi:outer membrane protein assembly factor BamB